MKTFVILYLSAVLCGALAEPLRYRQAQQVQATAARQTDGSVAAKVELGEKEAEANDNQETQNDEGNSEQVTEPPFTLNAPAPYYPRGWRPFGQLLVLPVAVRQNFESTTPVESSTLSDSETETTEENPSTEAQATSGQLQAVETSEPKEQKTAAHKRPTIVIISKGKKVGELKFAPKEESKKEESRKEESTENSENDSATTENDDADGATNTDPKSENLETTSEPDSEAVAPENSNNDGKQLTNTQGANQPQLPPFPQAAFFIQLPDGSFQRIVYVAPQTPPQAPFVPQPASTESQQLNQAPNNPFGFNPITNPRIVTFSTQYNAW